MLFMSCPLYSALCRVYKRPCRGVIQLSTVANDDRINFAPAHRHKLNIAVAAAFRPPTSRRRGGRHSTTQRVSEGGKLSTHASLAALDVTRMSNSGILCSASFCQLVLPTRKKTDDPIYASGALLRESMVLCCHRRVYFMLVAQRRVHA